MTSAAVVTVLIATIGWLARAVILERLRASVQHEFNERLESIKADLKSGEVRLQAELKAQDLRLQAQLQGNNQHLQLLQSGVLSARASRQSALDARRLDAIDGLWAAFHELAPLRSVAKMMETIKYDAALDQAAIDPKFRSVFQNMAKFTGVDTERLKIEGQVAAWESRLYVTDRAWKLFEVYRGVLYVQLLRLKQLEAGVAKDFTKIKETIAEVKAALPHQAVFLETHGDDVLSMLVGELGSAFELELLSMLRDEPRSADDLLQVGSLLSAAGKIMDIAVDNSSSFPA